MAIAFVQSPAAVQGNNETSRTTAAITTTEGNLVVIGTTCSNNFTSVTDSKSNTWSLATSQTTWGGDPIRLHYAILAAGKAGSGHTFTISSSAGAYMVLCVAEYSGVEASSPLDKTQTNTATASTLDSGTTALTAQANELLLGYFTQSLGSAVTWVAGTDYTLRASIGGADVGAIGALVDRLVSSTGTYNATATNGGGSAAYAGLIATLKDVTAGGGGGGQAPRSLHQVRMRRVA